MSNAERILLRLDELLNAPVELTLYGRAALALGFPETHSDFAISLDVDAILWMGQAEELDRVSNFWEALDQLNVEFEDSGLYMTHLFEESQVVLTPSWKSLRIPLHISTKHLSLYRLSDIDLMLSKLMRYDPIDLADLHFIITKSQLTPSDVANSIKEARIPDSENIHTQVKLCAKWLITQKLCEDIYFQNGNSSIGRHPTDLA